MLYQVYLLHLGEDPVTGNPSYYTGSGNLDVDTFKERFCTFLEAGSGGFFEDKSSKDDLNVGNKFLKVIEFIRNPNTKCPFKTNVSNWLDVG